MFSSSVMPPERWLSGRTDDHSEPKTNDKSDLMKTRISLQALIGVALSSAAMAQAGAAQLTDTFADRPVETGLSASFTGNSVQASAETGEPDHGGFRRHTLWGAWRAPANGNVT